MAQVFFMGKGYRTASESLKENNAPAFNGPLSYAVQFSEIDIETTRGVMVDAPRTRNWVRKGPADKADTGELGLE
jgi:hypothetical protein